MELLLALQAARLALPLAHLRHLAARLLGSLAAALAGHRTLVHLPLAVPAAGLPADPVVPVAGPADQAAVPDQWGSQAPMTSPPS